MHALCFTTPRPWSDTEFRALLSGPGIVLCGNPESFALGRAIAGEAELLTLAVHPGHRRAGLGRARLAEFEAAAFRHGALHAFLEVSADNAPARALYAEAGYRPAGQRPRYYRAPDGSTRDAVIMRKDLGP
nr:GNAT family N-acetyltransferase [Rhodovulum imhoffii]